MDTASIVLVLVQAAVAASIGVVLLGLVRWVRAQSPLVGRLLVLGVLLRAAAGLFLFWVSYLDAPWLSQLHLGNGFWLLALDAQGYYGLAAHAAADGLGTVASSEASPAYVRVLAVWMRVVGVSPASGFFLNLVLYAALGALLTVLFRPTGQWQRDAPCLVTLGAFTFSPALVIHATQPLKDDLFAFLIAIVCVASLLVLPRLAGVGSFDSGQRGFGAGVVGLVVAVYLLAGIRAYFAFLLWGSLALILCAFIRHQRDHLARRGLVAAAVLLLVWTACMVGAGPYGAPALAPVRSALQPLLPASFGSQGDREGLLARAGGEVHSLREGFVHTGGGTNITGWAGTGNGAHDGVRGVVSRVTLGLTLMLVPVSLLRALSLVEFEGGRGLLAITDLDTVFLNLSFIAVGVLLYRRRAEMRPHLPYLLLLAVLALVVAGLMAYVVTNFGTLFRLRLMLAVPLWMLPLALADRRILTGRSPEHRATATAA